MTTTYNATQLHLLSELYNTCGELGDHNKEWSDEGLIYTLSGLNEVFVTIDDEGLVTAKVGKVGKDGRYESYEAIDPSFKNIRKLVVRPEW